MNASLTYNSALSSLQALVEFINILMQEKIQLMLTKELKRTWKKEEVLDLGI